MALNAPASVDQLSRTHSLEQVRLALELSRSGTLEVRHALFVASQLVHHGLPNAGDFLAILDARVRNEAGLQFIARLRERNQVIQSLPNLRTLLQDRQALRAFYAPAGFYFRPGTTRPDMAIIVFTSAYNNYTFSNVVLDALLADLGVARLYLKDTSDYLYLRGVEGLADDLRRLPAALEGYLAAQGIRRYVITGFSSGGFAALYAASRMAPLGYAGFAITCDISPTSTVAVPKHYAKLRPLLPSELFMSAGEIMGGRTLPSPFRIFFGDQIPSDRDGALLLAGYDQVQLIEVPNCHHEVTATLLERRQLRDVFSAWVAGETGDDLRRPFPENGGMR